MQLERPAVFTELPPAPAIQQGVEQLYHRYLPVVARVCRPILRRPDLVEDAIQEVFFHLLVRDATGRPIPDPTGWFVRVARHQALLIVRRESARVRHEALYAADRALVSSPEDDPSWRAPAKELLAFLLASAKLRPCQRHALDLYRHGLTHAEIARVLGLSQSAVGGRIARALDHLRSKYRGSTRGSPHLGHPSGGPRSRGLATKSAPRGGSSR
jgi:RNA polymerase sigma-70 factor, ECF subfamily